MSSAPLVATSGSPSSRRTRRTKPLRICYAAGPGDVIGTFRAWRQGLEDPAQLAKTYSSEFFDACRELGCRALVISSHPRVERVTDGSFTLEHRPSRATAAGGARYHLWSAYYLLGVIASALRFRADVLVVSNTSHWYLLSLLPAFGVTVVPALHCTLWPQRARLSAAQAVLRRLNGFLFRRPEVRVMCVSHQILQQLNSYYRKHHPAAAAVFFPVYRPGLFHWTDPPPGPPFRIVFAGRVEADKGVFDLLEVARRLVAAGRDVAVDVYGSGGAEAELRRRAAEAGLADRFRLRGNRPGAELARAYQSGHVVVVPTTVTFAEGLNKVVIEGVLAGRPVVMTDVCPAADYLGEAAVVVPVGDLDEYVRAIAELADDPEQYRRRRDACRAVAVPDSTRSWGACLVKTLGAAGLTDPAAAAARGGRPGSDGGDR